MASEQEINEQLQSGIHELFSTYGEDITKAIKQKLATSDKLATGSLYESIHFDIVVNNTVISLAISGNEYLNWVDGGRRPGQRQPPIDVILKWIQARKVNGTDTTRRNSIGRFSKGFKLPQKRNNLGQFAPGSLLKRQTKLAWAIAKTIAKDGIPPLNVIANPNLEHNLTEDIGNVFKELLGDIVTKEFLDSALSITSPNVTTSTI